MKTRASTILSETSRAAARQKGRLMRRQPKAQTLAPLAGNRGFESTSLHRRVSCEPEFRVRLPSTIVAEVKYFNRTGDNLAHGSRPRQSCRDARRPDAHVS